MKESSQASELSQSDVCERDSESLCIIKVPVSDVDMFLLKTLISSSEKSSFYGSVMKSLSHNDPCLFILFFLFLIFFSRQGFSL